ncbi:hypothetical protein PPUJ20188_55310 [Pseudomonas putida]|nr:hypothetical protein PPUJ20188_55310 [Pseudomonas putida]
MLTPLCSLLTGQDGQATMKVCTTTTLDIPLAKQSSDIARSHCQTQFVTSQQ